MIGRIAGTEPTPLGVFYKVTVPSSYGDESVPVLAQLLDYLDAGDAANSV